jgi:peptidoglycan hydrolase-like protein with peptidoglycan-binding domain
MKTLSTPIINSSVYRGVRVYPAQMSTQSFGKIKVQCTAAGLAPVENASVSISSSASPESTIEQFTTDQSGLTTEIELPAPSLEYSMEPSTVQPYAEYTVNVTSSNFTPVTVVNNEILPDVTAFLNVSMTPISPKEEGNLYVIPPHTLYGDYPPKIAESEIKEPTETGEIVLSQVVIPEYVVVHDGPPSDTSAANYYIKFRDYIKNVASSEIYATWPDTTINANVLAILSFTLNRVFTEWYRNKGYNFTITSSTAFDHKWISGRNIFTNISQTVDNLFVNYLSRPNIKQPILTQYCDGHKVQCPNWMTQWGSKDLGDLGYTAIDILRNFYGDTIYVNTATEVSGVPSSWPGSELTVGSSGSSVKMIQEQLNQISNTYTVIPKLPVNSQYTEQTAEAVKAFQQTFELPQTGVVDRATWYQISNIYVAVTRIAE